MGKFGALLGLLAKAPTAQVQRWRWGWLLAGLCIAIGDYLSWQVFSTRQNWDLLDHWVFAALNASLAEGTGWHLFWAMANHRGADVLVMALFGLLMLWFVVRGQRSTLAHRFMMTTFTVGLTALSLYLAEQVFGALHRVSPSLTVEGAFRLSESVTDFSFKDASYSTFPGDHGIGLITLVTCLWFYAGSRLGVIGVALALPFVLPRLVVGAHWATDILVGSVSFAVVVLSITLATPLQALVVDTALRIVSARRAAKS